MGAACRGVWGEQWRGEEVLTGSNANGEKAENCDGLMPFIPTIPPSPPPSTVLSWTQFRWTGEVLLSGATVEGIDDCREKAKVFPGFMSSAGE